MRFFVGMERLVGSSFLGRKIGENYFWRTVCRAGAYRQGDREGGGSGGCGRPQNGLREAFPACFIHSNRAGNSPVYLWLKTQQKAGKRANPGRELDKSGSLSRIHIFWKMPSFCFLCVSVVCGKASFPDQRIGFETFSGAKRESRFPLKRKRQPMRLSFFVCGDSNVANTPSHALGPSVRISVATLAVVEA